MYRRYSMGDSVLPENRAQFDDRWNYYCESILEPNPAADYLIDFINRTAIPDMTGPPYFPYPPVLKLVFALTLPS